MPAKLDRCVEEVKKDHSEDSAWAICQSSIREAIEKLDQTDKSQAVGYPNELQKKQREEKTGFHSLQSTPITGSLEDLKKEVGKLSAILSATHKVYNYTKIIPDSLSQTMQTAFDESEHPRDNSGEFTSSGGGGGKKDNKKKPKDDTTITENRYGQKRLTGGAINKELQKVVDSMGGSEKNTGDQYRYRDHIERKDQEKYKKHVQELNKGRDIVKDGIWVPDEYNFNGGMQLVKADDTLPTGSGLGEETGTNSEFLNIHAGDVVDVSGLRNTSDERVQMIVTKRKYEDDQDGDNPEFVGILINHESRTQFIYGEMISAVPSHDRSTVSKTGYTAKTLEDME